LGANLDTRAEFAELGLALQHDNLMSVARGGQRCGEPADTATHDHELGHRRLLGQLGSWIGWAWQKMLRRPHFTVTDCSLSTESR
jgi:hypothetical protein